MFKDDNTVVHFKKPISKFSDTILIENLIFFFSSILSAGEPHGCDWKPRDQGFEGFDARDSEASGSSTISVPEEHYG